MKYVCEYCKNSHDGSYASGRFCSHTCKQNFCVSILKNFSKKPPKLIKCKICGKMVRLCYNLSHQEMHKKEKIIKNTLYTCEYCNKTFYGKLNNSNRFCKIECAKGFSTKAKRKEINKKVSKALTKEKKLITKQCAFCKNDFETYNKLKKYCSNKCISAGVNSSPERRRASSERAKKYLGGNRNNYAYGWYTSKTAGKVFLESSYEYKVAKELDENNINWIRPSPVLWKDENGIEKRYFPDFLLIDFNIYLDPKNSYLIEQHKDKIDSVIEQNNIIIIVLDKNNLTWKKIKTKINDLNL